MKTSLRQLLGRLFSFVVSASEGLMCVLGGDKRIFLGYFWSLLAAVPSLSIASVWFQPKAGSCG